MNGYEKMVAALAKPGSAIVASLTPEGAHLLHMAVGVSGELLDAVKKAAIYCKPIDRENVIEELGDLEFYMQGLRSGLGITRDETLAANMKKMSSQSIEKNELLGLLEDGQAINITFRFCDDGTVDSFVGCQKFKACATAANANLAAKAALEKLLSH